MPLKLSADKIRLIVEVLFAVLVLYLLFSQRSCNGTETVTTRGEADSIRYWQNKYGELVASQKALPEQFAYQDARIKDMLDSVARVYDTKSSRIQEMIIAVSRGVSRLKPVPGSIEVDTVRIGTETDCPPQIVRMRSTFENPYYTARVQIGDSSYHVLESRDTMTTLWKTVGEGGIFNRRHYLQLDLHFADTSRKITGLTSYRRLIREKQLSVGPEARVLWLDRELRPMAGLGITKSTRRWDVGLSGGKDFTRDLNIKTNGWYGEARIRFKLLKL